ncbi:hypothetical protein SPRG_06958 [Saprolegnia parasitica CBS 223.65]|uniref:Amino acid transporter transmembrane domain-containing protein n=1 Tax=Saprolegnia parasitica (strain CBS 223.65) TaxID=695850 RepID=A0A067CKQ9_SAPPC|nr:hypothetical protein SPRG_06958 [Saprolegnia parasitica CBS 223.65]KDO27372.1 hypothetical protein SPRG_06958 [Saprolegnia parasitica CBS 223.65]|eukprot:XP_012201813.1 hypothetical protein SPRG_06958 [Saprolegnia parasitica CBS 223.65]
MGRPSDAKGLLPPLKTPTHQPLSTWEVTLHLLKGNIGAGALSLPYAFAKAGVYVAPVVYLFIVRLLVLGLDADGDKLQPERGMTFGDVGGELLGKHGKRAVNVFLVGTQLSFCCVFFTVVATNLHAILPAKLSHVFQERQLILLIFPILLGLSWIRSLHKITPFSALATLAVLLGIAIVFYYSYVYASAAHAPPPVVTTFSWSRLPAFYGTAVYSFEGIGLILPLEKDMHDRRRFRGVLLRTMAFILILFLFLGEVPVLAFGSIENGSMTAVLQMYFPGWSVTIANLLLAIACLFLLEKLLARKGYLTPSIQSYSDVVPPRSLVCPTRCAPVEPPVPQWLENVLATSQYEVRRTLFRSMLVTCLMLVAICVPNVGLLISLFGSVGSSMLAVILPPVFYLALERDRVCLASWALHLGIVAVGCVGMVAGTIQALDDIIATFQ